ncbi:MAG TPA: NADPH-dependent F420 reductase, partial [Actinomycetota bacterium]|nr:NADPH-dependent F420 reductase [Actinomycetota bacterium]
FHEIRVSKFAKLDHVIDADTIVCSDDEEAKKIVMELSREVGVRSVDGGPLATARYVEAFVAVLITINFRYKASSSYRITGLPDA